MRFIGFTVVLAILAAITYVAMGMRADVITTIEPAAGGQATYSGTLTYLDRMALMPDAQIEIQIVDDQDETIADIRRPLNGAQVPVPFSITVDTARFVPDSNYYLVGALTQSNQIARVTDKVNLAFTQGGDHILGELMTRRVDISAPDTVGQNDTAQMDETQPAPQPYHGTTWRLTDLNGIEILPNSRATIVLGADGRMYGNGGCNNIGGGYVVNGDSLEIQPNMISTMMACPDGIDTQERDFTQQLVGTHTMIMDGDTMMLQAGDGRTLKFIKAD